MDKWSVKETAIGRRHSRYDFIMKTLSPLAYMPHALCFVEVYLMWTDNAKNKVQK